MKLELKKTINVILDSYNERKKNSKDVKFTEDELFMLNKISKQSKEGTNEA